MESIPRLTTQSCLNMHQIASHIHSKHFRGQAPGSPSEARGRSDFHRHPLDNPKLKKFNLNLILTCINKCEII